MKNRIKLLDFALIGSIALVCSTDTALAQTNTLTVNPQSLTFTSQNGTPQPQFVTVTTSVTSGIGFTAVVTAGNTFLGVSPTTGIATPTGDRFQVYVLAGTNLATGTYTGTVEITPSDGSAPQDIQVTYNVNTNGGGGGPGVPSANPASLTFNVAVGKPAASQTLSLTVPGTATSATLVPSYISGGATGWLALSPTTATLSSSPVTLTVSIPSTTLAAGTYQAQIGVFLQGSAISTLNIPVTLNVGSSSGNGILAASPSALTFSFTGGSITTAFQSLTISTTSNSIVSVTAVPETVQGSGWLSVNGSAADDVITITASLPGTLSIGVKPNNLTQGTYNGSVTLTTGSSTVTIPVTVTVGTISAGSELAATPNPLAINVPTGTTTPTSQILTVSTINNQSVIFTASASDTSGDNFLSVSPSDATATPGQSVRLTVSVTPGLSSGSYQGTITLTPSDGGAPTTVQVNVTVGAASSILVSPSSLSFAYQTGTALPPAQNLTLTSSGVSLPFSVSATTASGGNWLVVNPQTGATAATGAGVSLLTVQVQASQLHSGTYSGTITITSSSAANPSQTIDVTLLVTTQPIVTISSNSANFSYQFGTATFPTQQQIEVTSSGNPLQFIATVAPGSGGNFLLLNPTSGTTPGALNLSIDPAVLASLAPGAYSATVTVSAAGAGNSPVNLDVTLVIGNNTVLTTSQASLNFNYQIGKAVPAIQTIAVSSSGAPLNYTVTAASANCGGSFLTASPASGSTAGTVAVSVVTTLLTAGVCNGTVTITAPGAGDSPLTIPVSVNVSNSPLLNVSPGAINLNAQVGTSPANQTIALTSTDSTVPLGFNVSSNTNNGAGWLLVGPTSGSTPNNLTVGFQTASLAVGTYTGSITVTPTTAGVPPTVVPVTVVITTSASASASPVSLTFNQAFGGSAPPAQSVQITSSTAGLTFSATASTYTGGNWLTVTPANGTTPGALTATASGSSLGQGSYSGVITVVIPGAANTPLNIPVTLTIGPTQNLTLGATALSFSYQAGSATGPAAQTVQLTSTSAAVSFTAAASSSTTGLLAVTPASGTTPGTLSVSLNQSVLSGLAAGTYTGTVTVGSANLTATQAITVTVTVQPSAAPAITSVVNSASNQAGAISPGEIITIYGTSIGPSTAAGLQLGSDGKVSTTLAGTEVTFDGVAAPLIYVSAAQINAIVPYEIAGRANTSVVVQQNGVSSGSLQLQVTETVPAVFSLSLGGSGQGAILNQNGTVNGSANPASPGSVISIYATGEGALSPAILTGSVTGSTPPFPVPLSAPVAVTIGGASAAIEYAGEAPGLVSGALQINAVVPLSLGSGAQPIVVTIGSANNAAQKITVFVGTPAGD